MYYAIAEPNQYLAITGAGVNVEGKIKIKKKAFVWPVQRCTRMSISPFDFSLHLQAMTIEKLQFALPAVFTIGPEDTLPALRKYAALLTGDGHGTSIAKDHGKGKDHVIAPTSNGHVQDIVKGIIEGETRVIVSGMTMEQIFKDRQIFKEMVIQNVQRELDQFGLRIYNANVKELQDTPGSEYFAFLSRKAHEGALNQAKVDVAEARAKGAIGEADKQGHAKQEISRINADTAVLETERKAHEARAEADFANTTTLLDKGINLAKIQARREAEARDAELQKSVEQKRAEMELERLRAIDVTQSKIQRESDQEHADGQFYMRQREADGERVKADAAWYARLKEAEGLQEMSKAYGSLAHVFGGPHGLLQYLMLERNTYEKLANANANAIKGLEPKITVWNTGDGGSGDGAAGSIAAPIRNIFQTLPPLLSTINDQTGIAPPSWMAQMPGQGQPPQHDQAKAPSRSTSLSSPRRPQSMPPLSLEQMTEEAGGVDSDMVSRLVKAASGSRSQSRDVPAGRAV
ncbi:MAG: hypothetical protein M4579_004906 [Chaenotheca gracillima]|nr:MAG: hypothetical protein M4579_004906 [Chaenotheca gracillima]